MPMQILLVDDDPAVHETLVPWLSSRGYSVTSAEGRSEALQRLQEFKPSVVVLDASLPGSDTVTLCSELSHACPDLPILMLSARQELLGQKTSDTLERLVALEERLKRVTDPLPPENKAPEKPIRIEPDTHTAFAYGVPLSLTVTEFGLLRALNTYPGQVMSRQMLLDLVWGEAYNGSERTVDSHIRNLRSKLRTAWPAAELVESVRSIGYRLNVPA